MTQQEAIEAMQKLIIACDMSINAIEKALEDESFSEGYFKKQLEDAKSGGNLQNQVMRLYGFMDNFERNLNDVKEWLSNLPPNPQSDALFKRRDTCLKKIENLRGVLRSY